MKAFLRIGFISLWAVACLLGIWYLVGGSFAGGSRMHITEKWEVRNVFQVDLKGSLVVDETLPRPAAELEELIIEARQHSVELVYTSGDSLRVLQYGAAGLAADEMVTIHESPKGYRLSFPERSTIVFFGVHMVNDRLVVEVPDSFRGKLDAQSTSGSVTVKKSLDVQSLRLASSSGSVKAEYDLVSAGNVSLSTTSGSIRAEGIKAQGDISAKSTSGSVHMEGDINATGAVSLESRSGSVRSQNVKAASLKMNSTSGSIKALGTVDVAGAVKLSSLSGSVTVEDVLCESLSMTTTSGSVKGEGSLRVSGELHAGSTSGSVKLGRVECGQLRAGSTSGSVIVEELCAASAASLNSVSGSVKVTVPSNVGFSFTGDSTSGSITGDYAFAYTGNGKSHATARNLGGEMELTARTTSGSIKLMQ